MNQHFQRGNKFNRKCHRHGHSFTLDRLKPGNKAKIRYVGGECALRRRLLDMGLTPDTVVLVRKIAPLGDPIEIYLRNYELTIRRDDAKYIEIEEVAE